MNRIVLILFLAVFTAAASAQTASKSSATGSSTPKSSSSASKATKPSATASSATTSAPAPWIKLPPGVPKFAHGPVKMPFALHYEDIKVGTGAKGEAGKLWHLKYTGWRAADGVKFDSSEDHKLPVVGKDGKPELGPDGKPKMGDPQPLVIPQGMGRVVIPGFDYGLEGMKIGGKRRMFIPWQMAYGTRAIPDRPDHPGIPPKSDLIFDVELVDVTDMPQHAYPPASPHPGTPGAPAAPATAPGSVPGSAAGKPSAPPAPGTAPANPSAPLAPGAAAPSSTPPPAKQPATPAPPPAGNSAAPAPPPSTTAPPVSK